MQVSRKHDMFAGVCLGDMVHEKKNQTQSQHLTSIFIWLVCVNTLEVRSICKTGKIQNYNQPNNAQVRWNVPLAETVGEWNDWKQISHIEGESIEDISIVVYFVYIENASSPLHVQAKAYKSAAKKKAMNVEIFTVWAERTVEKRSFGEWDDVEQLG